MEFWPGETDFMITTDVEVIEVLSGSIGWGIPSFLFDLTTAHQYLPENSSYTRLKP